MINENVTRTEEIKDGLIMLGHLVIGLFLTLFIIALTAYILGFIFAIPGALLLTVWSAFGGTVVMTFWKAAAVGFALVIAIIVLFAAVIIIKD